VIDVGGEFNHGSVRFRVLEYQTDKVLESTFGASIGAAERLREVMPFETDTFDLNSVSDLEDAGKVLAPWVRGRGSVKQDVGEILVANGGVTERVLSGCCE
jgi:hypothetical protein